MTYISVNVRFEPFGYFCPDALRIKYAGQPPSYRITVKFEMGKHLNGSYQVCCRANHGSNRRIAKSIPKFLTDLLTNSRTQKVLLLRIERLQSPLRSCRRYEDLVFCHMTSGSMVLTMGDTPRVIWHTKPLNGKKVRIDVTITCECRLNAKNF